MDKAFHFYFYSYFKLPLQIFRYSETVGSIIYQEGTEIRNLKRTKVFSSLIKIIIPTKAGKAMNSTRRKKNYSMS